MTTKTNIADQSVSGIEWEERFRDYARYAILTKRGFIMQGSEAKVFQSVEEIDLKPGQQIIKLPTALPTKKADHDNQDS